MVLFIHFPPRDSKETWSDFKLILKVLDIFDVSLRPPNNDHLSNIEISSGKGKDVNRIILKMTLITTVESYFYFYKDSMPQESEGEKPSQEKGNYHSLWILTSL